MLAAGMYDLGLTAAEFWSMTPRMFHALWRRHQQTVELRERMADMRIAPLTCRVFNYLRDSNERSAPFLPADLFPSLRPTPDRYGSELAPTDFPTVEQLRAGRRATEERRALVIAGLPVEEIPRDEKTETMIGMLRDFTEPMVNMPRRNVR